jgi:AAA domain-containing protein
MMSAADIAAILAIARRSDCKVIVTGDHEQLSAVEGGGAMMLLARRLGYVQLAEPERFANGWERDATLRLRSGDVTVLAEYEEHGRLRGGTPEEAIEQAYRGWLTDHLAGLDSLLIARTEEQARELSRRARDDLIRYGRVRAGAQVRLAAGEHASVGDLITARRNSRDIQAGQEGRDLANRDVLRITAIAEDSPGVPSRVQVCRRLEPDPVSGEMRWSEPFRLPRRYLANHASLGYASTAHAALGRTTDTAHVLVDGLADRQSLYVGLSRGRQANYAYCITQSPRLADIAPGSRRAPELDQAARLDQEQAGLPSVAGQPDAAAGLAPALDPVTVLAGIMTRDGSELSATETLEHELARADHLGVLGGIWDDVTQRLGAARYAEALRTALPAVLADQALNDPACTWLWRTLREAESAGLDGCAVLREAVAARSMSGARDIARVLDARVRQRLDGVQPQVSGRWADRVPAGGSAELITYLRELAELMDDRTRRLGEHAAVTQPHWARQALGPVPRDPAAALDWERRASVIAAYRERYGYDHPADPIGPEPAKVNPEARAAWQTALAAAGRIDGIDLRHCTDGELWLRRGTYERETAWAPPHVGTDLRLIRTAERDAHVHAVRAEHEARIARRAKTAERHQELARRWRAIQARAATEAPMFTQVQQVRREWDSLTQATRRIAVAADLELRRRHPRMPIPALVPHPAEAPPDQQQPAADRLSALGLTLDTSGSEIPAEVYRIRQAAAAKQAEIDELKSMRLPVDEHSAMSPGLAWPELAQRERAAVRQQPEPEITPSARIVSEYQRHQLVAEAEPEREAE